MILARYILKEHLAPFITALFVITFLFVVDYLVKLLDNVLSKGIPFSVVLEIFVLNLAWILSLAIPMAVLVACLMAFGRLSGDQEITAVKAAGISPFVLMRPMLLVGILMAELLVLFNNWILPEANHRSAELMMAVSRKKPHAFIDAGRLITQFPGVQLWVNRVDPATGRLYGVQIFELQKRGVPRFVFADSADMRYVDGGATLILDLHSGENHAVDNESPENYFRIHFSNQELATANVDERLEKQDRTVRSDREMPIEMMYDVVRRADSSFDTLSEEYRGKLFPGLKKVILDLENGVEVPDSVEVSPADPVATLRILQKVRLMERGDERTVNNSAYRLELARKQKAQYLVEIHKKFGTSFASFIFVLVGVPLGIMARKGGIGTGIIYSLAFFVLYWASLLGGENLADRLIIPPAFAMWFSDVVIGIFGLILTVQMLRDRNSGNSRLTRIRYWLKEKFSRKRRAV